jgi:hypothetical protein
MTPSKIVRRILTGVGEDRLWPALTGDLPASDLNSLLLEVFHARARAVREPGLLARAGGTLFAPSNVDARALHEFDRAAYRAADGFEALELSPACPFGVAAALGGVDQNNVLTALRGAEAPGDATPALALECARRRRSPARRTGEPVRLAASQRVLRLQPCDFPGFSQHFRLFVLATAGRDAGSHVSEMASLAGHVRFYLDLCRGLNEAGFSLREPLVEFSDLAQTAALLDAAGVTREEVRASVRAHLPGSGERFLAARGISIPEDAPLSPRLELVRSEVAARLAPEYPEAQFRFRLGRIEGLGYYTGLCLDVAPLAPDGQRYPVADGGFNDWTARLLQDKKERLLTSGIGSEFVCRKYRVAR